MAHLIAPNGSVVSVSDDDAERLIGSFGYKAADEKPAVKKAPASKPAAKKSE